MRNVRASRMGIACRAAAVGALMGSIAGVGMSAASAAPLPMVTAPAPATPSVVYTEDFENVPVANTVVALQNYVGAGFLAETYGADTGWLSGSGTCNGIVLSGNANNANGISCANYSQLESLAKSLGTLNGSAVPANNHVVSAYTANNPGTNALEFATATPIPLLSSSSRFITFSVNADAINCTANGGGPAGTKGAPLYKFYLVNPADSTNPIPTFTNPINPCLAAGGRGTFTSDKAILFGGSSLGIRMLNGNGSGIGNDAAFDDIRVLDATPQLSKDFAPDAVTGQPDTLTFTIVNTTEKAEKDGWSFTDALPTGMTVASTPNTSTTCSNTPTTSTVTATAGGSTIAVAGNLAANSASCTVSVDVMAPRGDYTNGSGNITSLVGLNPPDDATVTFNTPPVVVPNVKTVPPTGTSTLNPLANDSGNNGATLDPTSVKLTGTGASPDGKSLTNSDGTYTVNPTTGVVSFTPVAGFTGNATTIGYSVTDSNGTTGSSTISLTTFPTPTLANDINTTTPGTPVATSVLSNDTAGSGATLNTSTLAIVGGDNGGTDLTNSDGTYHVDQTSGQITFMPAAGFTGPTTPITYEVTDSNGVTGTATLSITVAVIVGSPLVDPGVGLMALGLLLLVGFGLRRWVVRG